MMSLAGPTTTLAQAGPALSIAIGAVAVVVLMIAVVYPLMRYRRSLLGQDNPNDETGGLSLSDLRRLHRQGALSDAEYEAARAVIIGAADAPTENEIRAARQTRAASSQQTQQQTDRPSE